MWSHNETVCCGFRLPRPDQTLWGDSMHEKWGFGTCGVTLCMKSEGLGLVGWLCMKSEGLGLVGWLFAWKVRVWDLWGDYAWKVRAWDLWGDSMHEKGGSWTCVVTLCMKNEGLGLVGWLYAWNVRVWDLRGDSMHEKWGSGTCSAQVAYSKQS